MSEFLDPSAVRALAAELNLRPSKQRGQNFVIDANTVRRIVALAGVEKGMPVLEIGPGLGSLTLGLLAAGAKVTAIEIEESLANRLGQTVAERQPENAGNLQVIHADALQVDTLDEPSPLRLVANLPYNVAVPLVLHAFETIPTLQGGLVMVQLEVAERLCAEPGSKVYGAPSVKLSWFAQATKAGTVGPNVFWPKPNVDSGLVALTAQEPPGTQIPRAEVFRVVDTAFAQRRKMLRAGLSGLFGGSAQAADALQACDIDPTFRAENLRIADFVRIAEAAALS